MRIRLIKNGTANGDGWASEFNVSALNEVIVYYDDGSADSDYFQNVEILLSNGVWIGLKEALGLHLVIPDNYHRYFREPRSELERERGWFDA